MFFGLIVPSFANTANANTITNNDLNTEKELNSIVIKNEEIINQDLLEIEEQIKEYLDEIPYTEEEFEAMNDDEFDKVFEEYFQDAELLNLEQQYTETHDLLEAQQMELQPRVAPILVPILAGVARVALQTVIKHGTKVASKYLKNKIKKIGKNYTVTWNVTAKKGSRKGTITTLLQIQHKPTKQPVFRLDYGQLNSLLSPGPKDNPWFWHYHIGSTKKAMEHHYSLRAIIPAKYKPKSGLTLY